MAKTPGQQPNESNRDYLKRLRDAAAQQKQSKRDERVQDRLDHEAREERADLYADKDTDAFLTDLFGAGMGEVRKDYDKGIYDAIDNIGKAMKDVEEASRKRWFDSTAARQKRVEKAAKEHSSTLKKVKKANKKKKGWFW